MLVLSGEQALSPLVLALYGRHLHRALRTEGDEKLATAMITWTTSD